MFSIKLFTLMIICRTFILLIWHLLYNVSNTTMLMSRYRLCRI